MLRMAYDDLAASIESLPHDPSVTNTETNA